MLAKYPRAGKIAGMTEIESLKRDLRQLGIKNWRAVAEASGVPYWTIRKIAYGDTKSPTMRTFLALRPHVPRCEEAVA